MSSLTRIKAECKPSELVKPNRDAAAGARALTLSLSRLCLGPPECNLVEGEDHVEVNGEIFQKPFVEKPVCAEDHNVYIYYPTSAGGGSQRLFRKVFIVPEMASKGVNCWHTRLNSAFLSPALV